MAAFTSIIAAASLGVSAAAALNARRDAKKTASKQKDAQNKQLASATAQRTQDRKIADERAAASASALKQQQAAMKQQQRDNEAARAKAEKLAASEAAERARVAEASRIKVTEAQALDAQDKGDKVAEVAIGTSSASDALLKADPTALADNDDTKLSSKKKAKGRKIGGVSKSKRTVGGL